MALASPRPHIRVLWRPEQFNRVTSNPGFESATTGWSVAAGINAAGTSITRITTDAHSGSACGSLVASTNGAGCNYDLGADRYFAEASYGAMYVAIAWLKCSSPGRRARLILGSEGTSSDRATLIIPELPTDWRPFVVRWLPTASRTDVQLAITSGSNYSMTCLIDDVAVYQLDAFSQCENGTFEVDTTGWSTSAGAFAAAATSITRTAGGFGGSCCGRIVTEATATSGATYDLGGRRFISGRTYRVRAAIRSISGSTAIACQVGSAGGADSATGALTLTASWAVYETDWTPSADRTDVELCFRNTTAASRTFDIDEVEVYEAYDDVTAECDSAEWTRGASFDGTIESPGTITLRLRNTHRRFDPRYASSPLYGSVSPGRRVHVRAILSEVLRGCAFGTLRRLTPQPRAGVIEVGADDVLRDMEQAGVARPFRATLSYREARAAAIGAMLAGDPASTSSTLGASRLARSTDSLEGSTFFDGTDGQVSVADYLADLNAATGSAHAVLPSPHANIGWVYTTWSRAELTGDGTGTTVNDDFVDITGLGYSDEALENRQSVPWQGYEAVPPPDPLSAGYGAVLAARDRSIGGALDPEDPYLHFTRDVYGSTDDIPEPIVVRKVRRSRGRRFPRWKGRKIVRKRIVYPDAFVPLDVAALSPYRLEMDFAIPMAGLALGLWGPGSSAVEDVDVEVTPTRYVVDLWYPSSVWVDDAVNRLEVLATPYRPLDEQRVDVADPDAELRDGTRSGPSIDTPYIPSRGAAEGLAAYRDWRYGTARMRPTVEVSIPHHASMLTHDVASHATVTATLWNLSAVLFVTRSIRVVVPPKGLAWQAFWTLEELPAHDDWFTLGTSSLGGSDILAP